MGFYKPQFLNQWLAIYKSEGFKVLLKKERLVSYYCDCSLLSSKRYFLVYFITISRI